MTDQHDESSASPEGGGCGSQPPVTSRPLTDVESPIQMSPDAPVGAAAPPDLPTDRSRRAVKLVISLQPREGQGYHALLALGAAGCDPLFRSLDVDDPAAALAIVPDLLAEAEARWQTQPRYPTTRPIKTARSAPAPSRSADVPPNPPTPLGAGSERTESVPATKPTTGQLSLFG